MTAHERTEMLISDMKIEKALAQQEILEVVQRFEQNTGLSVRSVDLTGITYEPFGAERVRLTKAVAIQVEMP